ncbi:MAG: lipopolysaccharide kinase InaA family protein [Methylophilus sp.]
METRVITSATELQKLSSAGECPFDLLLSDKSTLNIEAIVRRVPSKRLVCKGNWNNQAVYVKLFFGVDAKRYAQRDQHGVGYLIRANIKTPKLLYAGAVNDFEVLVYQALVPAENAESVWLRTNEELRLVLALKLVQTVGQHHQAHLLQTDLYLKNFLLFENEVYTIDGDGIRRYKAINNQQAIKNFCVLLSKFDVLEIEAWLVSLLETYHTANPQVRLDIDKIKLLSNTYRLKVAKSYADQKVFRTCTDVTVVSDKNFSAISSKFNHLDLTQDANQYDALLASQTILKAGNTCTVGLVKFNQANVVVKRYNIKSFWHFLSRMWRPSRAAVSWANAHRLMILGIPTAYPIALLELRTLGLRGKAYFLSEYVDAPDIATFFSEHHDDLLRAEVIKNVVEMFYRLFLLQVSHGDMKATNIKILNRRPLLIDLDSMRQHDFAFCALKAHVKDLRRFMRNWKDDTTLYNAFIAVFNTTYIDRSALIEANILID